MKEITLSPLKVFSIHILKKLCEKIEYFFISKFFKLFCKLYYDRYIDQFGTLELKNGKYTFYVKLSANVPDYDKNDLIK